MAPPLECPMCPFTVSQGKDYWLQLHFEQEHTEDSPFRIVSESDDSSGDVVADEPGGASFDEEYCECPILDCGESVLLTEFNDHLDLHQAEDFDEETEASSSTSSKRHHHDKHSQSRSFIDQHRLNSTDSYRDQSNRHRRRRSSEGGKSVLYRKYSEAKSSVFGKKYSTNATIALKSARLGKKELGPYAFEEKMPRSLYNRLEAGEPVRFVNRIGGDGRLIKQEVVENETPGLIPVLAQLSAADRKVREAYYCHPSTCHIVKIPREGGFSCGYRNIQMLVSYIQGTKAQGHTSFSGRMPTVLKLQDHIEDAWAMGINEACRVQTGGIKGTRKWIGTPEVQALFCSLEIDSDVALFSEDRNNERGPSAFEQLFNYVENYFKCHRDYGDGRIHKTTAPPIYLQYPGHSLTIVGIERDVQDKGNLVVFDPIFKTSPGMQRLQGRQNIRTARPEVMSAYRRGNRQLQKHKDFEIFMLTSPAPEFPVWGVRTDSSSASATISSQPKPPEVE